MTDFLSRVYATPVDAQFIQEFVKKARQEHELEDETASWDYIEYRIGEWLPGSESWLRLAMLHYMLGVERNMRKCLAESLTGEKQKFYTEQWEPYLLEQTRRMKEAIHEDTNGALRLYSDSLREAWQWQRVEHSIEPVSQVGRNIKPVHLDAADFASSESEKQ